MRQKLESNALLSKAYEPRQVEEKWYQFWLEKGYFTPKIDKSKKPFVITMPPPNITGELHLGHALTASLEDALIRWHRMRGEPTLWLPGVDHAGIAGQNAVEQILARENLTRHDLGRKKFLERMWQWVTEYRSRILVQHQKLGASCDWTREKFTMDEGPAQAVRSTFVNLYKKGLIYRGERIINWCPRCATALSDLEVEHKEKASYLYYIRYKFAQGEGSVTVATTRPETLLGDTAVAVNPDDERFKDLIGKKVILPALGRLIPIVADEAVDPSFGTGAVKITPAHDPVDFEIGQRNNLDFINILNLDATINENGGPYEGLDRFDCREKLLSDLEKEGLLEKIEPYSHSIGHCQRCQTPVEPLISKQWFVKMALLAERAIKVVEEGQISIVPERFTKIYLNWLENIRDWCISRQLWWGHQIPVWYCNDCGELTVEIEDPKVCAHCGSKNIFQDPDVLDTWFSSALWPHSTLGWPEETEDFRYFYPTTVMETGYDILFFWVARMVMMGLENTGKIPFEKIYLHGLIRDEKGEKMSKTRGNVVDPLSLAEKYGTDALRFALITGVSPGNDLRLSPEKLEGSRNFVNKLWNAARFVLSVKEEGEKLNGFTHPTLAEDRWILSRLNRLLARVGELLEEFQLGEALYQIHNFFWNEFCDWYIEIAKIRIREKLTSPVPILVYVLETTLRLLHPFLPYVTEEIWQRIPRTKEGKARNDASDSIMIAPYPAADERFFDLESEQEMERIFEIVRAVRNARVEASVEVGKWIEAIVVADGNMSAVEAHAQTITKLARVQPLTILKNGERELEKNKAKALVLKDVEVILPFSGMLDFEEERKKIKKEIGGIKSWIAKTEGKLKNDAFLTKAPVLVVEREHGRLKEFEEKLSRLEARLLELSG